MNWLVHLWGWIEFHTGTVNESGPYYGFFSGFGSDLGEIALIGGLIAIYRKHNCHVKGCFRIAKHSVEGTPFITCKKHHPNMPKEDITVAYIKKAYTKNIK